MKKSTLSIVLATNNEEANLDRCLNSVTSIADEIVIADEKSTDKTIEIARKYHAKVLSVDHNENFHITKNIAIDSAKCDWILQLDADEAVSPELAQEILQRINTNSDTNGYWMNRKNWFLNRFLTKGGQYPDPTLRLYKRGLGKLPAADVHEQARVAGRVDHLKHDLLHYRDTSFTKYLEGFNRYSTFISLQMHDREERLGLLPIINYLLIRPLSTFLMIFLRHRGYVDGMAGFIFALFSGLIHPVAYIKYWQHTNYPA